MKKSLVKFFDKREGKYFGFLVNPCGGPDIFFSFSDGGPVRAKGEKLVILNGPCKRLPQVGDAICYDLGWNRKGPKASPWCFADDWAAAVQGLSGQLRYRLMKLEGGPSQVIKTPWVIWEGSFLEELDYYLYHACPYLVIGSRQYDATGDWYLAWFERSYDHGEWQGCNDPRAVVIFPRASA